MIEVSFISPTTGERVVQVMTEAQAANFWKVASQPIKETCTFIEVESAA